MPLGTGATILESLPGVKYSIDPDQFFANTSPAKDQAYSVPIPAPGATVPLVLPKQGIIASFKLQFIGTLVTSTDTVETSDQWPYNVLANGNVSINGAADLWNLTGIDLRNLFEAMHVGFTDDSDVFPGTVGGGDTLSEGTFPICLTWEFPFSIDPTSLVGALFAQSDQSNITAKLSLCVNADVFSANPTDATLAGNFVLTPSTFEIPYATDGSLILPDLSMLHGCSVVDNQFSATGPVTTYLVRTEGQLERLFFSARCSDTQRLSASAAAAADITLQQAYLTYGLNKVPLRWNPATNLLAENNQNYGHSLSYDTLCIDTLVSNPIRDAIVMAGLTQLALVIGVDSAVTVSAGGVHLVEEVLY